MQVCESLGEVLAHTVAVPHPCVHGEQGHVLEVNRHLRGLVKYAQDGFRVSPVRSHLHLVEFPFPGIYAYPGLAEVLPLLVRGRIHEFYPYLAFAPERGPGPYAEAVPGVLLETYPEEALVVEPGVLVVVPRVGEPDIVRVALKWTVVADFHLAETLPSLQGVRELERTVLDQLRIEAAVRCEIDVFEENAVHGRLDVGSGLREIDFKFSRHGRHSGCGRSREAQNKLVQGFHL